MGNYSIKDLEILSGIKAHTLRIWEQRYNIIKPSRTDTNIRQYTGEDLKLLLNISLLSQNGYKISKIAGMSPAQLYQEIIQITDTNHKYPEQIHALTLAMIDLDEARFEKIMAKNILQFGLEKTMLNIIYPFMTKTGLMWQIGSVSPGQEHFISNLIRQKLIVAIDGQYNVPKKDAKKFLLFLPEGELHELSLLFAHYILRVYQQKSIYLGQSIPFNDLVNICDAHQPDYLITVLTSVPSASETQKYINRMGEAFSDVHILFSGNKVIGQHLNLLPNISVMNKLEDLIDFMGEMN